MECSLFWRQRDAGQVRARFRGVASGPGPARGRKERPTHLPNGICHEQSGQEAYGGQRRGNSAGTDVSGKNPEGLKDGRANPDGSCISGRTLWAEGATGNASPSGAG